MAVHAEGVFPFAEATEGDVAFLSTPSTAHTTPPPASAPLSGTSPGSGGHEFTHSAPLKDLWGIRHSGKPALPVNRQ